MLKIVEKWFKKMWKRLYNKCEKSCVKNGILVVFGKNSGKSNWNYKKNTRSFTHKISSVKISLFMVLHNNYNNNLI